MVLLHCNSVHNILPLLLLTGEHFRAHAEKKAQNVNPWWNVKQMMIQVL